jgi:hypothetical protein
MQLLTTINDGVDSGDGLQVPNAEINCNGFRALYQSRASRGRSEGAGLSDLFWYFLSPGPEIHPEQLEDGPKYDQVNVVQKRILSLERTDWESMLTKYAARQVDTVSGLTVVRLRDWYMELFAAFLHEMVFGDEASPEVLAMIVRHATNVIETLKWCELRDMPARLRVVQYCQYRLRQGALPVTITEGTGLSEEELALLLANAFFNTGVVQSSEAMTHASLALAQYSAVARELAQPNVTKEYCQGFVNECFRMWPLFGIAHRILTADVTLPPDSGPSAGSVVPKGTVVCFNYPEYHSHGYDAPHELRPERWSVIKASKVNFCPFGIASNRPCPAQTLVTRYMLHLVPFFATRLDFETPVVHSRSTPGAGPCVISRKGVMISSGARRAMQIALWAREELRTVMLTLVQFRCSSVIVGEAKSLRLCARFFDGGQKPLSPDQDFDRHPGGASVRKRTESLVGALRGVLKKPLIMDKDSGSLERNRLRSESLVNALFDVDAQT